MKINSRIVRGIHVLDCIGKITLGEGTMAVRTTVGNILEGGGKKIVLNLANVISIDRSGVCELVNTYATVMEHGGQLKLQGLTKRIRELATSTRLLAVFQIYDSEPATIVSFT